MSDALARMLTLLPAETAHRTALMGLKAGFGPRANTPADPVLKTALAGLELAHPVGLAAGFDKNAEAPDALLNAGFGFVEVGAVTPRPQAGNPQPRLFRLRQDKAVINRMGFNNEGLDAVKARLEARQDNPSKAEGPVGVNLGATRIPRTGPMTTPSCSRRCPGWRTSSQSTSLRPTRPVCARFKAGMRSMSF